MSYLGIMEWSCFVKGLYTIPLRSIYWSVVVYLCLYIICIIKNYLFISQVHGNIKAQSLHKTLPEQRPFP